MNAEWWLSSVAVPALVAVLAGGFTSLVAYRLGIRQFRETKRHEDYRATYRELLTAFGDIHRFWDRFAPMLGSLHDDVREQVRQPYSEAMAVTRRVQSRGILGASYEALRVLEEWRYNDESLNEGMLDAADMDDVFRNRAKLALDAQCKIENLARTEKLV